MVSSGLDAEAYSRWIGGLTLERQSVPDLFQVVVAEDAGQAQALAQLCEALERRPLREALPASQMLERILTSCKAIAVGRAPHVAGDIIKEHFLYHDRIVAELNGRGLSGVFEAFRLRVGICETEQRLSVCLFELIAHVAAGLAHFGMLGQDPSAQAKVFIVNGFYRSGSTKVFLAGQAILRATGRPYATHGLDLQDVDRFLDQIDGGAFPGEWHLIKTHQWMPRIERDNVLVFFTRRNLPDVAASHLRRALVDGEKKAKADLRQLRLERTLTRKRTDEYDRMPARSVNDPAFRRRKIERMYKAEDAAAGTINLIRLHQFINDYVLPKYALHIIDYDDYAGRDEALIGFLAEKMQLTLSSEQLREAGNFINVERIKAISDALVGPGDAETMIQSHHISATLGRPGGGLSELPRSVIDELKHFGLWRHDIAG
ncbi:MAG TPA: hypothetical protein VG328_03950 [Stellaceae bacterium]|jgi:hypothetical protein|nr:hypothetical protein [Stellaceae bacterium]